MYTLRTIVAELEILNVSRKIMLLSFVIKDGGLVLVSKEVYVLTYC